jgi:hypothetical protein
MITSMPAPPFDAPQTGRRTQLHFRGERDVRNRRIALQLPQDRAVDAVELAGGIGWRGGGGSRLGTNFRCVHWRSGEVLLGVKRLRISKNMPP